MRVRRETANVIVLWLAKLHLPWQSTDSTDSTDDARFRLGILQKSSKIIYNILENHREAYHDANSRGVQVCRSYARNIGKSVAYKTLYRDVFERDEGADVDSNEARNILKRYVSFLTGQYMFEELEGWDAPIKSRSRLRVKPKMTFADPSLPASLLGMSGRRLLGDMQTFGNLFEELVIHDLRVYASAMEGRLSPRLFYYSDADGLEVDVVIELSDGRWGAIEIKLNGSKAHEAEKSLLRLKRKVASNPMAHNPDPSFLAVVTGNSPAAYRLESGVLVIPLVCLGA